MGFVFILLVTLVLTGGGTCYGYLAGYCNFRMFAGGLFVITVVLSVFFLIATTR